mgnify:FL=1
MLAKKFVLGTANFGMSYGTKKTLVAEKQVSHILNYFSINGGKNIDTANPKKYGNSEQILGKNNLKKYLINTKISNIPNDSSKIENYINKSLKNALKRLKLTKLNGVFLHNEEDLLSKNKKIIFDSLIKAKKKGLVSKIGVSFYNFKNLEKIISNFKIDMAQVPFNLFDRRLKQKNFIYTLKKKNIEIHIRSIFLQGVLLSSLRHNTTKFKNFKYLFENLEKWLIQNNKTKLEASLDLVTSEKSIDRIIIGVDNLNQLKQIMRYKKKNNKIFPKQKFKNNKLIDPRSWDKKVVAIIQARSLSKRFPNKVLKKIKGKTIIEIIIQRLKQSRNIDEIVVAIPKDKNEKKLENHLKNLKCKIFKGNNTDLLDRYYKAAKKYNAKVILRVTADCPLIDANLADKMLDKYLFNNFDLVLNYVPPTYPDGLDLAILSFEALKKAWKEAKTTQDREHVIPYLIKNKKFSKFNFKNEKDYSDERWTLDEPEDLIVIKNIFNNVKNLNCSFDEVLKLKEKKNHIFEANKHIKRDSGFNLNDGQKLWLRAKKVIPGGNMLLSKRPEMFLPSKWPTYFKSAKGCRIVGIDNKTYTDMSIMGIGTNILGYGHSEVDEAVKKVIKDGNMSTFNCPEEVYLSEKLIELNPWAQMAKFTRSGGEANAVAMRIARAASGKEKVAVCGYHGWHDWYLAANLKDSDNLNKHLLPELKIKGVPKALRNTVYTFSYNNFSELLAIINKEDIGVVKMEVSRNFRPKNDFLKKIRKITQDKGIVLIFDECTSGFRETYGGLYQKYNVEPDICIYGKALGNGYAVNAVVGKKEIMSSAQTTFISSTFWTERIGSSAALKTLEVMKKIKSWETITKKGQHIKNRWKVIADKHDLKIDIWGLDPLAGFTIKSKDSLKYKTLITQELLKKEILASNVVYLSIAHNKDVIEKYLYYLDKTFKLIKDCEDGFDINKILLSDTSHNTFKRLN